MILIFFLVKISSNGPALHYSKRIGIMGKPFLMPKFRTMRFDTPQMATHLLANPDEYLTGLGKILRRTSIDELPQIFLVLYGWMSFVGPRPALFNQYDLIKLRKQFKIDHLKPGITGYAQINGRDEISISEKVELDKYYQKNYSIFLDIKIIFLTIYKVLKKENIDH